LDGVSVPVRLSAQNCPAMQERAVLRLALILFHQVRLDFAAVWGSEREILAIEYKLYIFVLRRKQIINLVKNRSFVLSAIRLVGSAHCEIKQVIVDLGITADKITIFQNLSYSADLSGLLTFT